MRLRYFNIILLFMLAGAANVLATTRYVNVNGTTPVSPYTGWATAATNIQDAVNVSGFSDTVLVTNGIYQYGGFSNSGSNRVNVVNAMLVQSVNGPAVTIIKGYQVPGTTNGNNAVRCVYLASGSTLSGFTLTNGATRTDSNQGGGVLCQSTSAMVTNCIITGNNAYASGGGVYSGTVINCILTGNSAPRSSIGTGGGASGSTLINCILTGNVAGYRGGAAGSSILRNCTVVGNTGQPDGLDGCKIADSICYYNLPDNGESSGDGNSFTNCCTALVSTFNTANIITNPPLFVDMANGNYHLNAASPCINAGTNTFVNSSNDFDGNPRIFGAYVDLGAYEFQSPVHYVNLSNLFPVSPYTNWTKAAANIQDAVDAANAGDVIVVSNGIYNVGGRAVYGTATNRVTIDRPVTVQSFNGPGVTAIVGFNGIPTSGLSVRGVYLTNGAVLAGFSISNGAARLSGGDLTNEQSGGGVWCESGLATITNCVLAKNYAPEFGGGAYQGTFLNCAISNNSAAISGGGIYNATLNNCIVSSNRLIQGSGGGGATLSVLNYCLLTQNFVPGTGGGAWQSTLNHCVVSNNAAGNFGGGVAMGVANYSLISSNRAGIYGGGAYSNGLNTCVLRNNFAGSDGGGAYISTLLSCTVVSNAGGGFGSGISGGGATNSIIYYNNGNLNTFNTKLLVNVCSFSFAGTTSPLTNPPVFVNLPNGDYHLQFSSPCINAGSNSFVTSAVDFDGNPRIVGGTVDIGAYEMQTPPPVVYLTYLKQYGLPTDGSTDNADADGDGMSNYSEWRAGTNPTNSASVLQLAAPVTSGGSTTNVVVTWQSVSGVTYYLLRSPDLVGFTALQSNIVGQVGTTSYTDTSATNGSAYFYRVGVQ